MNPRLWFLCLTTLALSACSDDYVPPPGPITGGTNGTAGTGGSSGTGGTAGTGGTGGAAGTGGTGGTAGTGGTSGTSGTGGTGAAGGGGAGGTAAMGACDNQSDVDTLALLQPTNARQIAANCGLTPCSAFLAMEDEFKTCVDDCINDRVEQEVTERLSTECTSCYGDVAWCSRLLCLSPCATDACTPLCLTCSGYDACVTALSQCAGRNSIDCIGDT